MTTKDTIQNYFEAIHGGGWEDFVADEFVFINNNLDNVANGKAAYVQAGGRFFSLTTDVEIKELLVDGDQAAVLARYQIKSPTGKTGVCDVAEFIKVKDGKLTASTILFDAKALGELTQ